MKNFNRAFDALLSFTASLGGVMIVFLIVSVCYEVVARYFFNKPTSWVTEIGAFILLILPFLATGWVLKEDKHIRMDLLYDSLSRRNKLVMDSFTSFLSVVVCVILVWRGTGIVAELYREHTRTDTSMLVVQWPFMAVIPFGILLFMVEYLRRFIRSISLLFARGEKQERSAARKCEN